MIIAGQDAIESIPEMIEAYTRPEIDKLEEPFDQIRQTFSEIVDLVGEMIDLNTNESVPLHQVQFFIFRFSFITSGFLGSKLARKFFPT